VDPTYFVPGKTKKEETKQKDEEETKSTYLDSSFESEPVLEYEFDDQELEDPTEYGYGSWVRYLSTYPEKHTMDPD
jgi:hypothetical protein